jgi:signal transduction histidine kinase/HPt (histidine-containing phosphotransfer) domain-containing protein
MSQSSLRILLVEDNPGDAELLRASLSSVDGRIEILHVERMAQATPCLQQDTAVDVVLLDLALPDSMGLATLDRACCAAPHLPVIVLTSLEDEAIGMEAVRKGAQDYLVKGQLSPSTLLRLIHHAMERHRLHQSLARLKEAAEAANEAKSQFLANVSHELRTPMNAILGMTELALGEELSPAVRDYLTTAKESADVLLELLNEILDLSRMEAGKFQLEPVPFSPQRVVEQTLKAVSVRAAEKGLKLRGDLPADLPDSLFGDALRLRQMLVNLVGNAIKFTPRGEVTVRARNCPPGDFPGCLLEFAVSDTGIGIAAEDQERIFAPFTQADASMTRGYGGSGLGLAITSHLVHLMGGRIWVESQLGQGSTFLFTVKLALPPGAATAAETARGDGMSRQAPPARTPPAARSLRILLAEDNPANQKVGRYILQRHGHRVEVAGNGQEAVARVSGEDFDLVLMDVQMPTMDGFRATAAIRALADPRKATLPIVAMTAHAMKGDQQRCLAAGMDGYITKPIDSQNLLDTILRLTGKPVVAPVEQAPPLVEAAQPSPPAPADGLFDLEEAVCRCFGKYELFRDMAACLFEEAGPLLQQMAAAIGHGDAAALDCAAHRLKGTVAYLGAPAALDATRRVEQISQSGDLSLAAEAIRQLQEQIELLQTALLPHRAVDTR